MDQIIQSIIEEAFKSKKQQRYFYAKANDESLPAKERKKWKKWASEFSEKTNFKKLPEVAEDLVDVPQKKPYHYTSILHFGTNKKIKEHQDNWEEVQEFVAKYKKNFPESIDITRFDESGNKDTKTWIYNQDTDDWDEVQKKSDQEIDEIVDEDGNIMTSKIPLSVKKSGITVEPGHDKKREAYGSMGFGGPYGVMGRAGGTSLKYWAEADMHNALGFDDTMNDLESYGEALKTMMKDFNLSREEAIERLKQMGYDQELEKNDEVILVENPKKFIEEYIDNILLNKKTNDSEIVEKDEYVEKEINPIILKQLEALKRTLKNNEIPVKQIIKYLKENK